MADDDLFDEPTITEPSVDDQDKKYLETLVGEGKKFKTEEDLARGKVESDKFITKLQSELQELREDFKQRLALEELVGKIETNMPSVSPASNQPPQGDDERDNEHTAQLTQEQVDSLVQQSFQKQQEVTTQKQNVQLVRTELEKAWGDNYVKHMESKTKALGFGKDFSTGLAATHPQAFLNLMLDRPASNPDVAPNPSSVRSQTSNTSYGKRKYKDFQKMRKENPTLYHSSKVQMEMHNAAMEQGEDFYN